MHGLFGPFSTWNPVTNKWSFGYVFPWAFFPCCEVAELENPIRNLPILVAQTLNTAATALEEQGMIDGLAEVVQQTQRILDVLASKAVLVPYWEGNGVSMLTNKVKWYNRLRFWNKILEHITL